MPDQKTTLEVLVSALTQELQGLKQALQQGTQTGLQTVTAEKSHEEVSEAETLRSLAPIDKLNGKLTYDLTLMTAFETLAQDRRQREEMHSLRMREAETSLRFNNAKWQQELRHADIATENQWIDGADPLDVDAIQS